MCESDSENRARGSCASLAPAGRRALFEDRRHIPSPPFRQLQCSHISGRRGSPLPQPGLSSRHLLPGPNGLAVQSVLEIVSLRIVALDQADLPGAPRHVIGDADSERAVLAAGEDINVVGHRHARTPLGPGVKPRDDRGVSLGVARAPREMCESRRFRGRGQDEGRRRTRHDRGVYPVVSHQV